MKKLLNLVFVEEYRRDMSHAEKSYRDTKLAILWLVVLMMGIIAFAPIYGEVVPWNDKYDVNQEWICPNRSCGYDNMNGIRYCGLCGIERGSRSR